MGRDAVVYIVGTALVPLMWGFLNLTGGLRRRGWIICRTEAVIDCVMWCAFSLAFGGVEVWVHWGLVPYVVMGPVWLWFMLTEHVPALRQHWRHEEDCEYGPRRRYGGFGIRLRSWRKVSLRPGFAPT